jgi:hypothetical protein
VQRFDAGSGGTTELLDRCMKHERLVESTNGRYLDRLTIAPSTRTPSCLIPLAERWCVGDSDHDAPADVWPDPERDQRGPQRHTLGEHPGAVDRVDNPDPPTRPERFAAFLASNAIGRAPLGQQLSNRQLGSRVDLGHWGGISLEPDVLPPAERGHGDRGSNIGQFEGERQVLLNDIAAHAGRMTGRAADADGR